MTHTSFKDAIANGDTNNVNKDAQETKKHGELMWEINQFPPRYQVTNIPNKYAAIWGVFNELVENGCNDSVVPGFNTGTPKFRIKIRESKTHGLGVFADEDIPENVVLTYYPCDYLSYYPNQDVEKAGHLTGLVMSERTERGTSHTKVPTTYDYDLTVDTFCGVGGNPDFTDNLCFVGHIINDGAKPTSDAKSVNVYQKVSVLKSNCFFYRMGAFPQAVISSQPIKKGEELFVSYGLGYWASKLKRKFDQVAHKRA